MKTIGFIDYYLDEWHANSYPEWIKNISGGEMEVAYAYGHIDSPISGMTTEQWCETHHITQCRTVEELIEKSDVLIVLSPDNCEMHEELCQLPLRSGKACYVDKTFAPDGETARRIFAIAEESGTPCYSTSALRFAEEYTRIDPGKVEAVNCWGPNDLNTYSIHQLEPMMMLIQAPAKRVLYTGTDSGWYTVLIEFADGRRGTISGYPKAGSPFVTNVHTADGGLLQKIESDFFRPFIAELVDFFRTGIEKVSHEETLRIMDVRSVAIKAMEMPGLWVDV